MSLVMQVSDKVVVLDLRPQRSPRGTPAEVQRNPRGSSEPISGEAA